MIQEARLAVVDVAHDGHHGRARRQVLLVLVEVKLGRLPSALLHALLLLVDPLHALRLGDRDDRLAVQHLAHLHRDALDEQHLDRVRLRDGQELAQRLHLHPARGNLEDLHRDSLVRLRLGAPLRRPRRLAAAPPRHLVRAGRVAELGTTATLLLVPPLLVPATRNRVGAEMLLLAAAGAAATATARGGRTAVVHVRVFGRVSPLASAAERAGAASAATATAATALKAPAAAAAATAASTASTASTAATALLVLAGGRHRAHELTGLVADETALGLLRRALRADDEAVAAGGRGPGDRERGRILRRAEPARRGRERDAAARGRDDRAGGRAKGHACARARERAGRARRCEAHRGSCRVEDRTLARALSATRGGGGEEWGAAVVDARGDDTSASRAEDGRGGARRGTRSRGRECASDEPGDSMRNFPSRARR